ncbi:MAG: nucleotide exchange factor GrpE [Anaerolineaceae bacterium]|nr:MAG: nucleotide exchange factor GrpE [Anaerolineaceae bacterium]
MSDELLNEEIPTVEEAVVAEEAQDTDAETIEEPSLEEQLKLAKEEAAKNMDSFLRAQAELSNARKRFEKQQTLVYVNANANLVSKLLPALDDFDRAVESVPEAISEDNWYEGIELVHRKLLAILESLNVTEIEALGKTFDPNFHDALAAEPSDEYESDTITRVMIKGYQLGEKVIRPSLVYVAA